MRKIFAGSVSLMLLGAMLVGSMDRPAYGWFFSGKNKTPGKHGNFLSRLIRKHRVISASQVGLVPGNPPAMYWQPASSPRAVLLCLHEIGLHAGVFDDLGLRMAKQGVAVYAIDLRGFGGWRDVKGPEGRMSLDNTLADVKGSVEVIHKLQPGLPVFILGEAMGGAMALQAGASYPDLIQGVITAAPGGEHFETAKGYINVASHMVIGPNKDAGQSVRFMEMGTPKPELREAFQSDDLVRLDVNPRELMDCQFFMYKTRQFAKKIATTPVLVVHGDQDKMSRPEGSTRVYDTLATADKQMLKVAGADHYMFEDVKVNDQAMDSTLAWIDQHLKKKSQ